MAVKISGDFICQGEREGPGRKPGNLLKGQCTKTHIQALISGSGRETVAQSRLESYRERAGGTTANVPVMSPLPTQPTDAIYPGPSIPLHKASAW